MTNTSTISPPYGFDIPSRIFYAPIILSIDLFNDIGIIFAAFAASLKHGDIHIKRISIAVKLYLETVKTATS